MERTGENTEFAKTCRKSNNAHQMMIGQQNPGEQEQCHFRLLEDAQRIAFTTSLDDDFMDEGTRSLDNFKRIR